MDKKVIVLNGAPSTGKDTIAHFFRNKFYFEKMEIKTELFAAALSISGISEQDWFERYENRKDSLKEVPWDRLNGISQREFLIKISEEWMKPVFGNSVFGIKAAKRILKSEEDIFIFSDGGFQEEFDAITSAVGEDNVLLIRLHRNGCSFEIDSRSHLNHKHEADIHNDSDIDSACREIFDLYVNKIL